MTQGKDGRGERGGVTCRAPRPPLVVVAAPRPPTGAKHPRGGQLAATSFVEHGLLQELLKEPLRRSPLIAGRRRRADAATGGRRRTDAATGLVDGGG